ncbi:MAG: FAD-binding oxidoreductase, partial [Akkermansiaceae bacterium]|nr:FAD-binding oxidoreductase [Akkermansiaceae bacterium]
SAILRSETTSPALPWHIIGQGLAGTCLAWEFLRRGIPFHITDIGHGGSSRVAAGLINPITGKNFEPSWRIDEFHPQAIAFFQEIENTLAATIWHPTPILRLASSEKEWKKITSKLDLPHIRPWISGNHPTVPAGFIGAVELTGGGRVDTAEFIKLSAAYFSEKGLLTIGSISEPDSSAILCQGAAGLMENQLGPHRCAKGEILTVRADWPQSHIRIGAGGWLVPIGDGHFRIGSTYEWNQLDEAPTAAGLERIIGIANKLGGENFDVTAHVAGIRPILRRSEPLIGKNTDGQWIFNALGSKGTLYAPEMACMLTDWIAEGIRPEEIFIYPTH